MRCSVLDGQPNVAAPNCERSDNLIPHHQRGLGRHARHGRPGEAEERGRPEFEGLSCTAPFIRDGIMVRRWRIGGTVMDHRFGRRGRHGIPAARTGPLRPGGIGSQRTDLSEGLSRQSP